jgi:release factor glutamine methyltransferase
MPSSGTAGRSQQRPMLFQRIAAARQTLIEAGYRPGDAALDAEVLARHVLGWDLARLVAHNREPVTPEFLERFQAAIERRARHEPVAFITGHREFWGLDFAVTPATLVPRPETEMIVEEALRLLPASESATVLDIGTGSGCVGVSIAHERPGVTVIATDLSHAALLVARRNARTHGVDSRVRFVRTDLSTGIGAHVNVIVSNPPYVPEVAAPALLPDVLRYEPHTALFGGTDGLSVVRRLFTEARRNLAPGGAFIVEFGFGQEDDVRAAAEREAWRVDGVLHDLQGIARTIVLRR